MDEAPCHPVRDRGKDLRRKKREGGYERHEEDMAKKGSKGSAFYRSRFIGDLCETPVSCTLDRDVIDLFGGSYSHLGRGPSPEERGSDRNGSLCLCQKSALHRIDFYNGRVLYHGG